MLVGDSRLVELFPHPQDSFLCRLKDCIKSPNHHHGEDYIAIFASNIDIAQNVVSDAPDEIGYPVQITIRQGLLHGIVLSLIGYGEGPLYLSFDVVVAVVEWILARFAG
jgi:hypothetical protein